MNHSDDRSIPPQKKSALNRQAGIFYFFIFLFCIYGGCPVPQAGAKESGETGPPVAVTDSGDIRQNHKKHILIVTSQPYVTDWFISLNSSLRTRFFSFLSSESKLSYEYIGSEGMSDPEYNKELIDWLRKKYARIKLDMVIAVMPASSQFILDHGDGLFPGIPIIYALPSKEQAVKISARPRSGLVKSASDPIPETIQRIRTLLPNTDHLLVVSGSGADDLNYRQVAREALQGKEWPKTVEYLTGLPADELAERLARLTGRTAVLMLVYVQDRNGRPLTTVQVMKTVAEKSRAPIFGFYDTVLGHGIVGGKLSNAESYGEAIAETALNLFTAKTPSPLAATVAKARDIYDWRQIEKWHIPKERLPATSDIRYRKISFWEEHLAAILLVAGIIVLQAVLIVALIFNLRKRRRAEADLRSSEKKVP